MREEAERRRQDEVAERLGDDAPHEDRQDTYAIQTDIQVRINARMAGYVPMTILIPAVDHQVTTSDQVAHDAPGMGRAKKLSSNP